MCNLCSTDPAEKKRAEESHKYWATRFESLAADYRRLAERRISPHSEEAKMIGARARLVIRLLVGDWI
jgi:hypothetical protein